MFLPLKHQYCLTLKAYSYSVKICEKVEVTNWIVLTIVLKGIQEHQEYTSADYWANSSPFPKTKFQDKTKAGGILSQR